MQENREKTPAPAPEMVRYLAMLHRAFKVTASYKETRNPEEALLGGELANALHNVPSLLRNYSESAWQKPSEVNNWIRTIFPQHIANLGAPEEIITLCGRVISRERTAEELGLQDDLLDLSLAPPDVLNRYLNLLVDTCVSVRRLSSFGNWKADVPPGKIYPQIWRDLKSIMTDESDELGLYCAHLAETVLPVIPALVRWESFDEAAFQKSVTATKALIPERFQKYWDSQFTPR